MRFDYAKLGPRQTCPSEGPAGVAPFSFGCPHVFQSSLAGYVPDDKYKLHVGDRISFQILEDRRAPSLLVVADSGEVEAPYVGRVVATDKTCKQLAAELKIPAYLDTPLTLITQLTLILHLP